MAAFDADAAGRSLAEGTRQVVANIASAIDNGELAFEARLPVKEGEDWNKVLQDVSFRSVTTNSRIGSHLALPKTQPVG